MNLKGPGDSGTTIDAGDSAATTRSNKKPTGLPFAIHGGASFVPYYHPSDITEVKKRTPSRESNFCDGEDVADNGSKNREITISGKYLRYEKQDVDAIGDYDDALTLISDLFSGQIYIEKVKAQTLGEWNPFIQEMMYGYTITALSSGLDEGHSMSNGIISRGENTSTNAIGSSSDNPGGPRGNV